MNDFVESRKIYAMAMDPIYIGTGGYTIGRVDNTIVRDPITNIPKIPGSSLAGTWRYYTALKLQSYFKDKYRMDREKRKEKKDNISELFDNSSPSWVKDFIGNRYAAIKCAGKDDKVNQSFEDAIKGNINKETGHCGHCIVCKAFGYSKNKDSRQGLTLFSDLNILFFPVSTRLGVRWITSPNILKTAGSKILEQPKNDGKKDVEFSNPSSDESIIVNDGGTGYLNLGWINLKIEHDKKLPDINLQVDNFDKSKAILVSDNIISQIINSNLEVRTSVSIDPLTGAAREGALFTSEVIPRGTIFYGEIRVMDKNAFSNDNKLPERKLIFQALEESKVFYEVLGIGGMVTRGFGRMKVYISDKGGLQNKNNEQSKQFSGSGGQNG